MSVLQTRLPATPDRVRRHRLPMPSLINKCDGIERAMRRHGLPLGKVLNVGSKSARLGDRCINLDIAPQAGVDVVGDAHMLTSHFPRECFDTVVLSAVLQYCHDPRRVLREAAAVLKPGGILAIDAPFIQQYCPDGADLWRFTQDGLRQLCPPHFEVMEVTVAIPAGSAVACVAQTMGRGAGGGWRAKAAGAALSLALWPLKFLGNQSVDAAGAFVMLARKV